MAPMLTGARIRTSLTHPLQIAWVRLKAGEGAVGLTLCPGKKDPQSPGGAWSRDLDTDLRAIEASGAQALASLIEDSEFALLDVERLPERVAGMGLEWHHLPIRDDHVPDERFETRWMASGPRLRSLLLDGARVVVHCRGGLGRSVRAA
jgi:ADP-ribosyl-[dinitrogen reductase] hydrolase